MKIPEFKRYGIGIIVEFRRIPSRFPNQVPLLPCPQLTMWWQGGGTILPRGDGKYG
jgi:hypothetical protein